MLKGGNVNYFKTFDLHPAAVRCDMVLHQMFRETCAKKLASAVSCDMVLHRVSRARHL